MEHSRGHIIEMAWSYAATWIRGVHAFHYRLSEDLPEDSLFFDSKITRYEVDFNCYLMALRRLERSVMMARQAWADSPGVNDLKSALDKFRDNTPFLADVRNTNEHFDDYLHQRGKSKSVDSRGMGVLKVEVNGKVVARQGTVIVESVGTVESARKAWTIEWLGHTIDLADTTKAADGLYQAFLKWHRGLPHPVPDE
jgi:hypothetical protein